ncbi:MAG: cell wall hydrolase [Lachnospiraceae bacterium]|nr:cell wall hydrolase [Lachnospiraceae bacterium]
MLRKLTYSISIFLTALILAGGSVKALAAEGEEAEANIAVEEALDVEESADGIEADAEEDEVPAGEAVVEEETVKEETEEVKEVKASKKKEAPAPQIITYEVDDAEEETGREYTSKDVKLLACLILAEAGNQPYKGKLAVANVVLNRVDSNLFPNTLKEVIYQKTYSRYYGRSIYQFSVSSPNVGTLAKALRLYGKRTNAAEIKQEEECIKAAKAALEGKYGTEDENYLFFRRYSSSLANQKPKGVRIAAHYFSR